MTSLHQPTVQRNHPEDTEQSLVVIKVLLR